MFEVPLAVAALMRDFEKRWCVAGGWAIDLFLGRETRPHDDIEIAVWRSDQLELQKYLAGWTLKTAANGELKAWRKNGFLNLPVHAVHCFNSQTTPHFLEVLLNENEDNSWTYRRNQTISRASSKAILKSDLGIEFFAPEIVLLYKSKNPRRKDEQDFQETINFLENESKIWLRNALLISDSKHRWLDKF
jgi:hypothetical protein